MLRNYLILSWKILRRRRFFTFVSLFGICLTLVVLMLVTALLDHSFGAMSPEVNINRMLGVFQVTLTSEDTEYRGEGGYRLFDQHLRGVSGVEHLSLATTPEVALSFVDGQRIAFQARRVDSAFFKVLQFEFIEGGPFTGADEAEARPLAVISRETRRRLFGGEAATGLNFELQGRRYEVAGVVENVPAFRTISAADVWLTITSAPSDAYKFGLEGRFQALMLVAPGADRQALRGEIERRLAEVDVAGESEYETLQATVETPFESLARKITDELDLGDEDSSAVSRLRALLGLAALLFMALPSLNLMNLNISRILERASEIGIRKSFGASSRTLVGQFLVENVLLTLIGGGLGFVLATVALELVSGTALVSYAVVGMNFRIFGWGLLFTLIFGVLSGVYPAWRMSRLQPQQALRETSS